VASNWVLTAAHVVGAINNAVQIGGNTFSVVQSVIHPSWNPGTLAYDYALMRLNSNVLNVTPVTRYTGSSELGQTVRIVGFGTTGTGLTGATTLDLNKRGGSNVVDSFTGPASQQMLTDFDAPGQAGITSEEQCVAGGDSGGALFINNGGWQLAGVTSYLWWTDGSGNADYGDGGGFGRVSLVNAWIDGVIVPEPGTIVILIGGVVLVALRRRR
jgi:hypothetical protein